MRFPGVLFGLSINKLPDIDIEGAEFLLHLQEGPRVGDRSGNFQFVADDAGIFQQSSHFGRAVTGYSLWIESVKDFAISIAFIVITNVEFIGRPVAAHRASFG